MNARETAARAELDVWLRAIGHDLTEPSRTIRGFLDLLQRRHGEMLEGEAREFVSFAVDAAGRLDTMLQRLLEFGQIGAEPCPEAVVDLGEVAEAVLRQLADRISETSARIEIRELPRVTGSGRLWRRLFGVLIENALIYRGAEPPLLRIAGAPGRVTVADNGIGIDPQFFGRVFEPFQRLHARDAIPGCGMGLAIARRIAEHQGCGLAVESGPEGGSVFVISLPSAQTAA
jgi:light-regulated signal transduction histidine kinase (bacteriophytochrome)